MLNAFRHQRKELCQSDETSVNNEFCVLNAFRHQRKELDHVSAGRSRGEEVLNAFRHQRKELLVDGRRRRMHVQCSTPFGINGRNS